MISPGRLVAMSAVHACSACAPWSFKGRGRFPAWGPSGRRCQRFAGRPSRALGRAGRRPCSPTSSLLDLLKRAPHRIAPTWTGESHIVRRLPTDGNYSCSDVQRLLWFPSCVARGMSSGWTRRWPRSREENASRLRVSRPVAGGSRAGPFSSWAPRRSERTRQSDVSEACVGWRRPVAPLAEWRRRRATRCLLGRDVCWRHWGERGAAAQAEAMSEGSTRAVLGLLPRATIDGARSTATARSSAAS